MSVPNVGVLALQGDTREHLAALTEAGARARTVRRRGELDSVDALVIPGGESTTMSLLLREFDLLEPLRERLAAGMPAYGSCAGMILLASEILDAGAPGRQACALGSIDMTVRRNAFGRQVDSFEAEIDFRGLDGPAHAVFIRAPAISPADGRRGYCAVGAPADPSMRPQDVSADVVTVMARFPTFPTA